MKAYLNPMLCLLIIVGLVVVPSSAQALRFDFDNKKELDEWEILSGQWEVVDGALKGGTDGGEGLIVMGDDKWGDYTVEMKIKSPKEPIIFGVVARLTAPDQLYAISMVGDGGRRDICLNRRAGGWNRVTQANTDVKEDTWYVERVICEGKRFQAFVDDKMTFDFDDPTHKRGKVGVRVWADRVEIDYFKVDGPGIPKSPDLAVQPDEVLATTWGRVKKR